VALSPEMRRRIVEAVSRARKAEKVLQALVQEHNGTLVSLERLRADIEAEEAPKGSQ
jgi:hypothetical protein